MTSRTGTSRRQDRIGRSNTRYDFLRQEHIIRANMAEPLWRQLPRAIAWAADYIVSGALCACHASLGLFRLGRCFTSRPCCCSGWVLSIAGGWLVAHLAARYVGLPLVVTVLIGLAIALVVFVLLRRLAGRWFVIQINSHWPYLCAFARGEPTCFDQPIEACAQRLVAAARANAVDEIVVIGHSGGGALAPAVIVARARARSRCRPARSAGRPADARLDRAGRGAASPRRKAARFVRPAGGRTVGSVDRLPDRGKT